RERGIRVLVHEAARAAPERLAVHSNASCVSLAPFRDFWHEWRGIPLTGVETAAVYRYLQARRFRTIANDFHFAARPAGGAAVRARLGVPPGPRLLALFNSSTDEFAGNPDFSPLYPTQEEWVERVLAWAAARANCVLVLRVHPCLAGVAVGADASA